MSLVKTCLAETMEKDSISISDLVSNGVDTDFLEFMIENTPDSIEMQDVNRLLDALWKVTGKRYGLDAIFYIDYFLLITSRDNREVFLLPDGTWESVCPDSPWGELRGNDLDLTA